MQLAGLGTAFRVQLFVDDAEIGLLPLPLCELKAPTNHGWGLFSFKLFPSGE